MLDNGALDKDLDDNMWTACKSDESEVSDNEYKLDEDENKEVKKFKKPKVIEGEGELQYSTYIKDPITYRETVAYPAFYEEQSVSYYKLLEMKNILPMGYPTEQMIGTIKNSIY